MTLKQTLFLSGLALILSASLAQADTTDGTGYRRTTTTKTTTFDTGSNWAGIQLGPNFSSFTNLDDGASGNTQFEVGGFVDWHLQDFWYLQTGLRYNSYGAGNTEEGVDVNLHVHYIEIPLLIKPTFDAGGWFPYVMAGPSFGFKTGEGVDASGNGNNVSVGTSFAKTFDFSMDFGLGAEIPIQSNFRAFAQFEYTLGLTNILQNTTDNDGETAKTRGAMLMFGVMASL